MSHLTGPRIQNYFFKLVQVKETGWAEGWACVIHCTVAVSSLAL